MIWSNTSPGRLTSPGSGVFKPRKKSRKVCFAASSTAVPPQRYFCFTISQELRTFTAKASCIRISSLEIYYSMHPARFKSQTLVRFLCGSLPPHPLACVPLMFRFDHPRTTAPSTSTGMALRGLKQGRFKGYTQMYAAPEYSSESQLIDKKVDVYAFGMVRARDVQLLHFLTIPSWLTLCLSDHVLHLLR